MSPLINPLALGQPSFLNAPRCTSLELLNADVAVIGYPHTTPDSIEASRGASSDASDAVRSESQRLVETLGNYDFDLGGELLPRHGRPSVVDCGDVWAVPGQFGENAATATRAIAAMLESGALPLIIGGDQAAPFPALRAYSNVSHMCVVHFAPDLDFSDEVNGVRDGPRSAMRRVSELPWVTSLVHVGVRGADGSLRSDVETAERCRHVLIRAEEVHQVGTTDVASRIPQAENYFISLDIGCLDPAIAPGVSVPTFGGLSYFELINTINAVVERGTVVGASLVGIVPAHDLKGLTSLLGARLILYLVGALAFTDRWSVRSKGLVTARG